MDKGTQKQISQTLKYLKTLIGDDYRATDYDTVPGMQVTFARNGSGEWVYQTGDNSYSGPCYGYPFWSVVYLYRRSNCDTLARDVINQWDEQWVGYSQT